MRFPRYALASSLAILAFLTLPEIASATAIHVSSFNDPGVGCTLRSAITAANSNAAEGTCPAGQAAPTVDTIDFTGTGVISLGSSLPAITGPVTITGPGVSQLTISGVTSYQPFKVNSGAALTLSGMTINNGLCGSTCGSQGGAINSSGALTLDDVVIANSTASDITAAANSFAEGGAIENNGGTLTITDSEIRNNTVTASNGTGQNGAMGGAIMNRGTATIIGTEIYSNAAIGTATSPATSNVSGGGIDNDGHLTIRASLISNNQVSAGGSGTPSLSGGGIMQFNDPATSLTIDASTIAANSTPAGGTAGGIYSIGNVGTITNSTIYGNSSPSGANIYMSTQLRISNTIVSNPTVGPNCSGAVATISDGYNLESANSCGFNQSTDKPSTPSNLGALTDNGGPTRTRLPLAGSAAIDAGKVAGGDTTDQRGLIRPSDIDSIADAPGGDGSDIGAVEVQDTVAPDTTITSGPEEGATTAPKAELGFSSSEGRSHFECSVDGGEFAACTSPDALAGLAGGPHTFAVRAIDGTGNADATPANRSFVVDATAPTTKLGKVRRKTHKRKLKVKFSSEAGATFECRVDSKPFGACASPYRTKKLKPGKHVIEVRATDSFGNVEAEPATAKVKVLH